MKKTKSGTSLLLLSLTAASVLPIGACTVGDETLEPATAVERHVEGGVISTSEELPGKVRGSFESSDPGVESFQLTSYDIGGATVVWVEVGDREVPSYLSQPGINAEMMATEMETGIAHIRQAPTGEDFAYSCFSLNLWQMIACLVAQATAREWFDDDISNSDCDMDSPAYNSCVADFPAGAGNVCRCANCRHLCDAYVTPSGGGGGGSGGTQPGGGCQDDWGCAPGETCSSGNCVPLGDS